MDFERISDYTYNTVTIAALGTGVLLGLSAVSPDFAAELRTVVYRTVDQDFDTQFKALGDAGRTRYIDEVRDNFADDKNLFGLLATTDLIIFTHGTRGAKRRRSGRLLNNV